MRPGPLLLLHQGHDHYHHYQGTRGVEGSSESREDRRSQVVCAYQGLNTTNRIVTDFLDTGSEDSPTSVFHGVRLEYLFKLSIPISVSSAAIEIPGYPLQYVRDRRFHPMVAPSPTLPPRKPLRLEGHNLVNGFSLRTGRSPIELLSQILNEIVAAYERPTSKTVEIICTLGVVLTETTVYAAAWHVPHWIPCDSHEIRRTRPH